MTSTSHSFWVARWKRHDTTAPWVLADRKYRGPYDTPIDAQRSAGLCDSFNDPSEFHVSYSQYDAIPAPPGPQGHEFAVPTDPSSIRGDLNHMLNPVIGGLRLLYDDLTRRGYPATESERDLVADRVNNHVQRIRAALKVAEEQMGFQPWTEEIEELRKEFGMGAR